MIRHQHKYVAEHTMQDRYLVVTHLPSGKTYTLNKKFQLNLTGRGEADSPDLSTSPRIKWVGDLPAARPDWAKRFKISEFEVHQLYNLIVPAGKQDRS